MSKIEIKPEILSKYDDSRDVDDLLASLGLTDADLENSIIDGNESIHINSSNEKVNSFYHSKNTTE